MKFQPAITGPSQMRRSLFLCFVLRECFESVLHAKAAATSEGTGSFLFSDVRMPLFSHRFHDTIVSEKTKAAGIGEMDKYEILKKYFGYDSFREGQENLIDALLGGQDALGGNRGSGGVRDRCAGACGGRGLGVSGGGYGSGLRVAFPRWRGASRAGSISVVDTRPRP